MMSAWEFDLSNNGRGLSRRGEIASVEMLRGHGV